MSKLILAAAVSALALTSVLPAVALAATAVPPPCEDSMKAEKAAFKTAKLSPADATKVADLEKQGIERCKADDDVGANTFFGDAMKIMGVKK